MRKSALGFAAYTAGVAVLNLRVLNELLAFSLKDDTASHLILIPLVSATLIYLDKETVLRDARPGGYRWAFISLLGLAMAWLARASDSLTLAVAAVTVLLLGGFFIFYGPRAAVAAAFPLGFLVFMIPVPPAVLDRAIQFLKEGSAEVVAILFGLTGTPYHRNGFVFGLPNFIIEIADECSGIRSSIALLLTGLLAGHMFLRTWWKKGLIALAIVPFAILKNGIRIVSLSLLAEHVDPGYLTGQLHHEGGIVFFLLTLALMSPFFIFLHRSDVRLPRTELT